jgi:glycosyltransferase involved in cell wall biosynthesis
LKALEKQTIVNQLEVIVIHDGEDDAETAAFFAKPETCNLKLVTYFSIPKSQQGVARNRGVEKATAPIVLFGQDDIFLAPDACEKHLRVHSQSSILNPQSIAVLGFTTWDPACGITPVMRWLEKTGWQFGYPLIARYSGMFIPDHEQERFTYTSHISVPTEIAKKNPFNEDATLYGWEDIEWGTRLKEANIPVFYESTARALHHHHVDLSDSLKRMETLGRSLRKVTTINPQLGRMPTGWKLLAYKIVALLPTMRGHHAKAFLHGLQTAA